MQESTPSNFIAFQFSDSAKAAKLKLSQTFFFTIACTQQYQNKINRIFIILDILNHIITTRIGLFMAMSRNSQHNIKPRYIIAKIMSKFLKNVYDFGSKHIEILQLFS